MAQGEYEIRAGNVSLTYRIEDDGIILTGGGRLGAALDIPERIADLPVRGIAKKAFLGQNSLQQVTLPACCRYVEEWAFAQCANLKWFACANRELSLGKGVFHNCEAIQNICIGTHEKGDDSYLLAVIPTRMEGEYLLVDKSRGSREWFAKWDKRLAGFLAEPDEEGYMKLALCGEEDIMLNIQEFMSQKRREKCSLCLIRLKHCSHLEGDMRELFVSYLRRLTKGCATEEAWLALFLDFDGDVSYYKVFADTGCLTAENLDAILLDMGQEFAEAKAYLLKYKEAHFAREDVFARFAL